MKEEQEWNARINMLWFDQQLLKARQKQHRPIGQKWQMDFNFSSNFHLLLMSSGCLCWERFRTMPVMNFDVCLGYRIEKRGYTHHIFVILKWRYYNWGQGIIWNMQRMCIQVLFNPLLRNPEDVKARSKEAMKHTYTHI